jgi:hypothetical protein
VVHWQQHQLVNLSHAEDSSPDGAQFMGCWAGLQLRANPTYVLTAFMCPTICQHALCMQLQQRVSAMASDLHALQMVVSGTRAAAAEGGSVGQQLRQQLANMQEQVARWVHCWLGTVAWAVS